MTISMVKSCESTETKTVEVEKLLQAIETGLYRKKIEQIRAAFQSNNGDRAKIDTLKKALPAASFSGTFTRRESNAIAQHSGLLCADLDSLGEKLSEVRAALVALSKHLYALFTSPSGDGLKAVFKVPADAARHGNSFRAIAKHVRELTDCEIDESGKDVGRLCFVSYDPDLYINEGAVPIEPLPPEPKRTPASTNFADLALRQRIAAKLLGSIDWQSDTSGFLPCPGRHLHTAGDNARDCEIHLDGAPTIHCFHHHCRGVISGLNHELRTQIGRAEKPISVAAEPEKAVDTATSIRGEIISILTDGKLSATEQRAKIAAAVTDSLSQRGQFFYHSDQRDFDSSMFFDNKRKRLERVRSDSFMAWLAEWICINRADNIFKFIAAQVETAALAGKHTVGIIPESFWASRPGAIYLSNGDGALARITPERVEMVDNGTDGVLFAAGQTLAPWTFTEPRDPFESCSVFSGANYAAEHGKDLLRMVVYSLPTNPRSKPPYCYAGDVGSGKTRTAKGTAELYGYHS